MSSTKSDTKAKQPTTPSKADEANDSSSTVMEPVPATTTDLEIGTRTYTIGDKISPECTIRLRGGSGQEVTKSLFHALSALDANGDGVIDDAEIASAARKLRDTKKRVNVLHSLIVVMMIAILFVAASTFGVSLWANKLSKDVYTWHDALTNEAGDVLQTREFLEAVSLKSPFELTSLSFQELANIAYLNFNLPDGTQLHFQPSSVVLKPDLVMFRSGADKVEVTNESVVYTAWGEPEPVILTKRSGNDNGRALNEEAVLFARRRSPI